MDNLLELKGINKYYNNIPALKDVNLKLSKGEVLCVLGKNGAGKSTLGKIISGAIRADSGEIYIDSEKISLGSPFDARKLGISMIYEDLNLIENMSVAENILICDLPTVPGRFFNSLGVLNWKAVYHEASKICAKYGYSIDIKSKLNMLGMGEKQIVAIMKALEQKANLLIMDEPFSSLAESDIDKLFGIMCEIKKQGISIIYITHNINDVYRVADRVVVINDGEVVKNEAVGVTEAKDLLFSMAGRDMKERYPKLYIEKSRELLKVDNISTRNIVSNVSFSLYKGEILGLTGLVGSGRSSIARAIYGVDKLTSGEIYIQGEMQKIKNPADAVKRGIAFLPEDRKLSGIVPLQSVKKNISIANVKGIEFEKAKGVLNKSYERKVAEFYTKRLSIKQESVDQDIKNLSGGSQQKVMISRWIFKESSILLFDEPTKGIDIASKVEIYNIMNELTREGKGILFISSDLSEILGMCDRILVVRDGTIVKTLKRKEATKELIMYYASGEVNYSSQ